MTISKVILTISLVTSICSQAYTQLAVTIVDEDEAADILTGPGVTWTSSTHSGGSDQLAFFEVVGTSPIGIQSGIVLTTGSYTDVGTGNTGMGISSTPLSQGTAVPLCVEHGILDPGDPCILKDMTELSLTFTASANTVNFQIVFASDEYTEEINSPFQDVMGVYMQGTNLSPNFAGYQNVSLIPGSGDFVSIDNVQPANNATWYVNNPYPANPYPIEYDGFTTPMTITVENLVCGESYSIVFSVANRGDSAKESALFIGSNSITSDFIVNELVIDNSEPFCEGEDISASINNNPDWNYQWSDGQSGFGSNGWNSVDIPATHGDDVISVTVTNPDGCQEIRTAPIVVHSNNNQAPSFLNVPDKLYMQMGDTICLDIESTDDPNENVNMSYEGTFPNANNYSFSADIYPGNQVPNHDRIVYCGSWLNFWDYGEYTVKFKLEDNNVCGFETVYDQFKIEVLCPSCPECLSIDHREPDYNPFFDGVIDAARCIKVGFNSPPGHGVDPDGHDVTFIAGESVEFGPGWNGTVPWEAVIEGVGCVDKCNDCCTYESELSYDPPADPYVLSPNNDGNNDVFFISDMSSPYNAYHSTYWELHVWGENIWNTYTLGNKIWYFSNFSSQYINHPMSPICSAWETPTQQHPYKTFWWDGTIGIAGGAWVGGSYYIFDIGDEAPPGVYHYEVDIDGCKLYTDQSIVDERGHNLDLEGTILLLPFFKGSEGNSDSLTNEETQDLLQSYDLESDSFEDNQVIFSVYPNPASEILHVSILGTRLENSLVEMRDAGGKLVYSSNLSNPFNEISVIEFERGFYTLRISNGTEEFIEKVILN